MIASPVHAQSSKVEINVFDQSVTPVTDFIDGDSLNLEVSREIASQRPSMVYLGFDPDASPVAQCLIPRGQSKCKTGMLNTLGWH